MRKNVRFLFFFRYLTSPFFVFLFIGNAWQGMAAQIEQDALEQNRLEKQREDQKLLERRLEDQRLERQRQDDQLLQKRLEEQRQERRRLDRH